MMQEQAMKMFKDKPVVILALEKELFDQIEKLLNTFDKQATPNFKKLAKSHSNVFLDNIITGSKRVFNLSVHNMKGHMTTALKIARSKFLGDLTIHVDLRNKAPTFKLFVVIMEYAFSILQTPALVDKLNAIFFPESNSEGTIILFFATHIDLWALYYLKVYPTEAVAAAKFSTSESNWRQKVYHSITCFGFMDEIHFGDWFKGWSCTQPSCYVNGVDMMVSEVQPLDKDLFSHKFKRAGYRYQVAVALETSKIVYVGGGVPCGKWPDLTLVRQTLLKHIEPHEKVAADQGYVGDPRLMLRVLVTSVNNANHNFNLKQMGAQHETVNQRFKDFQILNSLFQSDWNSHACIF
ncbi:hypothetical protein HDU77_006865 [Chytriomyces hyalinus]|nr:hypothetical protein HDU77_006865 [Chytriomyces hyalinus]